MSGYDIIVFLHVLAVIIWVGGGFMFQVLLWRASRIGPESVASFNQAAEWTSQRIFMPASFATLGLGIWAVLAGPWTFGESWIIAGLVGFAISAVNGSAVLGRVKKLKATIEERGRETRPRLKLARRMRHRRTDRPDRPARRGVQHGREARLGRRNAMFVQVVRGK